MDFSGYRYYKLSHDFLRYLGLWSAKAGWLEKLQRLVFCSFFITLILCQIVASFINECDLQMLSKSVVFILFLYIFLNRYVLYFSNISQIKTLLLRVQHDWNTVQNIDEYNILKKYAENGKFIRNLQLLCLALVLLCVEALEFVPKIFDVVAPRNESRPQQLLIMMELCLEEDTSNHLILHILLHITLVMGTMLIISCETFLVMLMEHICAMFKITSYRIQRAVNEKDKRFIYAKLSDAVLTHQKTIEFVKIMQSITTSSYSYLLVAGLFSIIMNMYHLSRVIMVTKDMKRFSEVIFFVVYQYFYLFICNDLAQMVINHSSDIFTETYDTQWYTIPSPAQKLLMFIMQRSMKGNTFTLIKIYVPSRQGFSMVMHTICNTILSYFTFLCSLQR